MHASIIDSFTCHNLKGCYNEKHRHNVIRYHWTPAGLVVLNP
jgi:hypothetical protein